MEPRPEQQRHGPTRPTPRPTPNSPPERQPGRGRSGPRPWHRSRPARLRLPRRRRPRREGGRRRPRHGKPGGAGCHRRRQARRLRRKVRQVGGRSLQERQHIRPRGRRRDEKRRGARPGAAPGPGDPPSWSPPGTPCPPSTRSTPAGPSMTGCAPPRWCGRRPFPCLRCGRGPPTAPALLRASDGTEPAGPYRPSPARCANPVGRSGVHLEHAAAIGDLAQTDITDRHQIDVHGLPGGSHRSSRHLDHGGRDVLPWPP